MKAIRVDEAGSYDALRTVEMEKPELGPGQVLVKTAAISVNFADTMVRRGIYPGMPPFPLTPGLEASGTVEAVGEVDGKINPHIHATFPLEEAPRAHELLESKAVMGKVLLEP